MKRLNILLKIVLFIAVTSYAYGDFKRYNIMSGMILYDIHISGTSSALNTYTVGISRLVFNDWGAREIREDQYTEIQKGDFKEKITGHTMSKIDHGTIYTVNFDEGVIYKTRDRNIDIAIAQGADMSSESLDILKDINATKAGTETIAGYTCDIWKTDDQSICIYKGIPLKIIIQAPGFISTRIAQVAILEKPISKKEFALPNFSVIVDKGYTSNRSAIANTEDHIASVKDLQTKLDNMDINLNDNNITLTKEQEREVINILGARYLKKQKMFLSKLMVAVKMARNCINASENGQEASSCFNSANRIIEELGDQTYHYNFNNWDTVKQEAVIKDIDSQIMELNITINCVNKYDKTTDVIECTEGSLEPKI